MRTSFAPNKGLLTGTILLGISSLAAAQAGPGPGLGNNGNQPPLLQDINPDPRIYEVNLTAGVTTTEYTPGVSTTVWAYNDSVPGPTIKAPLGQTLVVNFTNNLPEKTTIHWHGMEVPANMDGSNISQRFVEPGESFRYEFMLNRPAIYWYHPHFSTNTQVEKGLHGALIVTSPPQRSRIQIPNARDYVLLVDDVLLDPSGQLEPFASDLSTMMDPAARAEELFNSREGNHFIINGVEMPTIDVVDGRPIRLRVINPANGRFMRLSVPGHDLAQIGAGGGLLDNLVRIPPVDMVLDPSTGGMVSNPDRSVGLLLSPSERADVIMIPRGARGSEIFVEWHDVPMGRHMTFYKPDGTIGFGDALDDGKRPPVQIMRLRFVNGIGRGWHPRMPINVRPTPAIPVDDQTERLSVFFGHAPPMPNGAVPFFAAVKMETELQAALDGKRAEASDPANMGPIAGMVGPPAFMPTPFRALVPGDGLFAQVGDVKVWEVTNFTGGDHTFHTHGFPFQPLEYVTVNLDGDTPAERVLVTPISLKEEDSIIIPARPGAGGRSWTILRCAVRFDDSDKPGFLQRSDNQMVASGLIPSGGPVQDPENDASGGWLVHCHFLEHAAQGMLTFLNLELPD